jgi:glycogen debranching enzyme
MGLDRDKSPIDGIGSNQGHCLWTGIVDVEKAPLVARCLMSPGMFSGWGIRTLSSENTGYNPISYHCGSVWPHDNALCAAGLMRYGFVDEAHRVMRGMVDAAPWFGDLLPELFAGMPREGLGFPVSYPTSCSPQAWAAASPLLFLRTLLRFEPDIRRSSLHLAPAVADWIGTLRLERIPIMGGHLDIEVQGEIVRVVDVPEGLKIVSDPRLATRL